MQPDDMTPAQAADRAGVALPTVYSAIRRGHLAAVKWGRDYVITQAAFADWQHRRTLPIRRPRKPKDGLHAAPDPAQRQNPDD